VNLQSLVREEAKASTHTAGDGRQGCLGMLSLLVCVPLQPRIVMQCVYLPLAMLLLLLLLLLLPCCICC
jgi:hypothetical protein